MNVPGRLGKSLERCGRLLQVALDFIDPWEALRTGIEARVGPAVILEAGTPLIKSFGMNSVRMLSSLPGEPLVMADTKTMDTGRLETILAASYGADAVSVLAVAPDETIREAVAAGEEHSVTVYGDLIGSRDPIRDAERLWSLGVHIALFHIGIDVQKRLGLTAGQRAELVEKLSQAFPGPIAIAGGIRPGEVETLARSGARIIIIGGAITKSNSPRQAALEAYKRLGADCV